MDRRRFLRWLGVGMAVGAAAPSVIAKVGPACVADHDDGSIGMAGTDWDLEEHPCHYTTSPISQYADYAAFSSLSLSSALDATVSEPAAELSHRLGVELSQLVSTAQN